MYVYSDKSTSWKQQTQCGVPVSQIEQVKKISCIKKRKYIFSETEIFFLPHSELREFTQALKPVPQREIELDDTITING